MPEFRNRQKMMDIIAYSSGKKWLFLIETVHSPNPLNAVGTNSSGGYSRGARLGRYTLRQFATKNFASTPPNIAWRRRYGSPMTRITSPTSTEAASSDRTKAKGESADLL